jgi:hypothetical protein
VSESQTKAGRELLANLVGRFGQSAIDPVSHELTVADIAAIEAEAVKPWREALRYTADAFHVGSHHVAPFGDCGVGVCAKARVLLDEEQRS